MPPIITVCPYLKEIDGLDFSQPIPAELLNHIPACHDCEEHFDQRIDGTGE